MRKYYTRDRVAAYAVPVLNDQGHWSTLLAYVTASASVLGIDIASEFIAICYAKDAVRYLEYTKTLERELVYTPETSDLFVRTTRQLICFLKKFPFTKEEVPIDTRLAGIVKWKEAEAQCAATNLRLRGIKRADQPDWVWRAQKLISDLLGPLESSTVMKIINGGRHGPGSTLTSWGNRVSAYYKFADFPYSVTQRASSYALAAISGDPHWMNILESSGRRTKLPPGLQHCAVPRVWKEIQIFQDCVDIVDCEKVTFVPKSATVMRPIGVPASLNAFLQQGVGEFIANKLKKVHVHIDNQAKNQKLAWAGSTYSFINGVENERQFSTIDLASASDTISIELVRLLLPGDWFAFLSDLRHEDGYLDDEYVKYEKFSAMGNGYTFPLETMLFWAIAKATTITAGFEFGPNDFAVYGDDIIVRKQNSSAVIAGLEWSGFTLNMEKSFISGPFKESCGTDWFNGTPVRPIYLQRRLNSHENVYFLCNSLAKHILSGWNDTGMFAAYSAASSLIPVAYRVFIPIGDDFESGFQVPLASMRRINNVAYLSQEEKQFLIRRRLLEVEDMNAELFTFSRKPRPTEYRGKSRIRMYLSLQMNHGCGAFRATYMTSSVELAFRAAAEQGAITRRDAWDWKVTVRPVSNWDSTYSRKALLKHPANWVF